MAKAAPGAAVARRGVERRRDPVASTEAKVFDPGGIVHSGTNSGTRGDDVKVHPVAAITKEARDGRLMERAGLLSPPRAEAPFNYLAHLGPRVLRACARLNALRSVPLRRLPAVP